MNNIGFGLGGPSAGNCAPFGGVAESTGRIVDGCDSIRRGGLQFYLPVVSECMLVAAVADVPLSLVGDVVTLPYCLYRISVPPPPPLPSQPPVMMHVPEQGQGWMQGPVPAQPSPSQTYAYPSPSNGRVP